jgi:glyoxylase-like metal-dependent hydrolase (beta-lactamase superfamily II)
MQLYTINTGFFKLDGGAMFGVVPKSLWNKVNPADENNLCSWALRCLLIEDGSRLILVDNGIGNKQDAKFFSYYHLHGDDTLDKSLAAQGFHRNDITDVFLTHLHFDHCGGSIIRDGDRLMPAFPNAEYWSHSRHWKWATEPNDREKASFLKENILPIQESGRLRFVDNENAGRQNAGDAGGGPKEPVILRDVVLPGMSVRLAEGHTAAMMLPQISYKGRTVVFMADLLPSMGHFPQPYVMAYDMFPLTTMQEKRAFLDEAVAGDYVLFFEHDPAHECCIPAQTEKGIRPGTGFRLSDL